MKNLIEEIEASLNIDDSDNNRKRWSKYIVDNKIKLYSLLPLLDSNKKTATRFIWLVGDICELNPATVDPALKKFF